jgi:hypothetical protein
MSSDAIAVLFGLGIIVLVWKFGQGSSSGAAAAPPVDTTGTSAGSTSDPASTGLNNQSGTYSTGVQ